MVARQIRGLEKEQNEGLSVSSPITAAASSGFSFLQIIESQKDPKEKPFVQISKTFQARSEEKRGGYVLEIKS